jgi:hypothetical protein
MSSPPRSRDKLLEEVEELQAECDAARPRTPEEVELLLKIRQRLAEIAGELLAMAERLAAAHRAWKQLG